MPFIQILLKAIKICRAFRRMKQAKRNAYRESIGLPPTYPLYERPFRWAGRLLKALLLNIFCPCCIRKRKKEISKWDMLWINGTWPNQVLKGMIGLITGIIFTNLLINFLISQLNFDPNFVWLFGIIFGIILTIGLTITDTVRCLFMLTLPQFFNKKGRTAILAYCLVLALSGPGKNTAVNMEILTESMVCGQDMVTNSTRELVALAKEPFSALKQAISVIISSVKDVLQRMQTELKSVMEALYEIVNVVKNAYAVLKSVVNLCNKKVGTPFDRCMSSFTTASADCAVELGSVFSWMCNVVDVFQNLCYAAKIVDLLCWLPSLVKQAIFEPLKEYFRVFAEGFKTFFDVRLNITYKFDHDLEQSKTLGHVTSDMKAEILDRVRWFTDYVDWMDLITSFLMLLVLWKAYSYRSKFLNSDRFDNYYITNGMIRMDLERKRLDRDSVFPLRYRETTLYVLTFSWAMTGTERKMMKFSLILVALAGLQIMSYLLIDILLYWFLELIRKNGSIQFDTKEDLGISAAIEGEGFMAAMYRSILNGLDPGGGLLPSFDTSICLPTANQPNYHQYFLIIFLIFLCAGLAVMEPYGLRLRHIICGWVYPHRIIPRERWLYVHMLSSRDTFLTFARRQIRAKLMGNDSKSTFRVSFMDRLHHIVPCCSRLFRSYQKKCFLCGRPGDEDDSENFVACPNCRTVYCIECFNDMEKKCTACMNPIDYGDLTDASEEKGSDTQSDSDQDFFNSCCTSLCSKKTYLKSKKSEVKYSKLKNKESKSSSKPKPSKQPPKKQTTLVHSRNLPTGQSFLQTLPNGNHSGWLSKAFGGVSSKFTGKGAINVASKTAKSKSVGEKGSRKSKPLGSAALPLLNTKGLKNSPVPQSMKQQQPFKKSQNKRYQSLPMNSSGSESDSGYLRKRPVKSLNTTSRQDLKKNSSTGKNIKSSTSDLKTNPRLSPNPLLSRKLPLNASNNKHISINKEFKGPQSKNKITSPSIKKRPSQQHPNGTVSLPKSQSSSSQKISARSGNKGQGQLPTNRTQLSRQSPMSRIRSNQLQETNNDSRLAFNSPIKKETHGIHPVPTHYPTQSTHDQGQNEGHNAQTAEHLKKYEPLVYSETDDGEFSSTTVYMEEIDGLDFDGVCHHHQTVESDIICKFDDVLSQMSLVYPEMVMIPELSMDGCNEDTNVNSQHVKKPLPEVHRKSNTRNDVMHQDISNNVESDQDCESCGRHTFPSPYHLPDQSLTQEDNKWWGHQQNERFRTPPVSISPAIQDRVRAYNEFYSNMPYPPHCNL